MMKFLILILTTFVMSPLLAQKYTPIEDADMVDKHKEILHKIRPHVFDKLKIEGVYQINDKHSKIVFYENAIYHEAIVNSNRKELLLIATLHEIQRTDLPKIVNDAFKKSEFGNWEIKKTYKVKTPYEDGFYAIDVEKGEKSERLFYSDLGRYKKPLY